MRNFIQPGQTITITAGADILSGAPVLVGNMIAIAAKDIASGASGPAMIEGVFSVTKVGSQAWSVGDLILWDHTNSRFTKTASSDADVVAGVATEAAGSGAGVTTGYLKLIPGMGRKGASVADDATAAATDLTTTEALANALKTKINALLASLRAAGIIDT